MRTPTLLALLAAVLSAPSYADGWIDNVQGLTLDASGQVVRFTGLTVTADGKVGQLLQRGQKPRRPDWRYDGRGRVAMPGIIDAHGHVIGLGTSLITLDLSETRSLAEAQAKVREYAAAHPARRWIIGRGWNQERWGLGRFPTAADLDGLAGDRPVWLVRADGHAAWANTAAMQVAGVSATSTAPAGGRIEMAGGKPSGVFVDAAMELVDKAVPAMLAKERDLAFTKAQDALLSVGITAIADMGTSVEDWNAFRRAGDEERLLLRIFSYSAGLEPMLSVAGGRPTAWLYQDRLRMAGVKIYMDGALGSRGACLQKPYADAPVQTGLCFLSDAKLRNTMTRAAMDGFQPAIHAIGDQANAQVLDAIEVLSGTFKGDRRWRIEHAQIVAPADLDRFARHGIIASMQPVHQTSDRLMAEARLGPDRLTGAYAWRSLATRGVRLAFGSDLPVEPANPFPGIAAAISREDANGQPPGGWQPQEKVSREAAIAGFTTGGAYASFAEDRVGRLAPGFRADFILIDRDPTTASATEIRGTQVLETWVGGRKVWARPATSPVR